MAMKFNLAADAFAFEQSLPVHFAPCIQSAGCQCEARQWPTVEDEVPQEINSERTSKECYSQAIIQ